MKQKEGNVTTLHRCSQVNKEAGEVQVASFLTATDPEARKVFKTWNLAADEKKDIKTVIERSITTVTLF